MPRVWFAESVDYCDDSEQDDFDCDEQGYQEEDFSEDDQAQEAAEDYFSEEEDPEEARNIYFSEEEDHEEDGNIGDDDWMPTAEEIAAEKENEKNEREFEKCYTPENKGVFKNFKDCQKRTQFQKVAGMLRENTDWELNVAFAKKIMKLEQERNMRKEDENNKNVEEGSFQLGDRVMSALNLIKKAGLSRSTYQHFDCWLQSRAQLGESNKRLPPWYKTTQARKTCLPDTWPQPGDVTEGEAKVPRQKLLDHTAKRTLSTPRVMAALQDGDKLVMIGKEGGDGQVTLLLDLKWFMVLFPQSGMGKWATVKKVQDDFLYNEGYVPLAIKSTTTGIYLWVNKNPGGCENLRPIRKTNKKDTPEEIVATVKDGEEQVASLQPVVITIGDKTVTVTHQVHPSMHDGANIKALTEDVLVQREAAGLERLKKFGEATKLDFRSDN
jgi:hypothetical protein